MMNNDDTWEDNEEIMPPTRGHILWGKLLDWLENKLTSTPKEETPEEVFYHEHGIRPETSAGLIEKSENLLISSVSCLGVLVFTGFLAYINGYYFAGMRDLLPPTPLVLMMYFGGFALEGAGTSSLIVARRHWKQQKGYAVVCFSGFCLMGTISAVCQYLYYKAQINKGALDINNQSLSDIPFFSLLWGNATLEWVLWLRAIIFHLGILICTLLIPQNSFNIEATIEKLRKLRDAQHKLEREHQLNELQDAMLEGYRNFAQRSLPATQVKQPIALPQHKVPPPVSPKKLHTVSQVQNTVVTQKPPERPHSTGSLVEERKLTLQKPPSPIDLRRTTPTQEPPTIRLDNFAP